MQQICVHCIKQNIKTQSYCHHFLTQYQANGNKLGEHFIQEQSLVIGQF